MNPEQAVLTDNYEMLSDADLGANPTSSTFPDSGTISGRFKQYVPQQSRPPYIWKLSTPDNPLWLEPIISDFSDLLDLPPDWDSYGAAEISKDSVKNALQLLFNIMQDDTPRPHVVPTTGGNVQLEWHTGDIDIEIEIEAYSAGRFNLFFEDLRADQEQEWEEEDSLDYSKLQECINLLTSRVG
jgi:hypothetical protein